MSYELNMDSIMSKLEAWVESSGGKTTINKHINEQLRKGQNTLASGTEIISEDKMWQAVAKFITVLRSTAQSYDLPESVMRHIDMIESSGMVVTQDGAEVNLYFGGDLHRDSLENDEGYEGIDNIIALFNNGYDANAPVYGWWNNHSPQGEAFARSMPGDTYAWVRSLTHRDPLHFIQQAVMDFNGNYGAEYDVTIMLDPIYEE